MRFDPADDANDNIEDRRGQGGRGGLRLGIGGVLVVGVLSLVFRRNLFSLLDQGGSSSEGRAPSAHEDDLKQTAVRSFNDAQRFFASRQKGYRDAKLVLFWDETHSGCGAAAAEMGPFYCPPDQKVYIDLGFYDELAKRFKAPGQFAQAYVMAHEVAHHVQSLLGTESKMRSEQRADPSRKNELSVRLELQADCFAGIWGHDAGRRGMLDTSEVEQGLTAASAIGDDRIQKMAGRRVSPESFTHGSSAMRVRWFRRGLERGRLEDCDTFGASSL